MIIIMKQLARILRWWRKALNTYITGYTVNSYINRAKIEQAYRELSSGEVSVGDIAEEYGFNDISYFTKVFKKYTNLLPSKVKIE